MEEQGRIPEEQGKVLLDEARRTIRSRLFGEEPSKAAERKWPDVFHERRGTFVTITINGNLRGCIGHILPQESLVEGVRVNAVNAAFRDPRFPPLSRKEYESIHIEVSILTDPKPLAYSGAADLLTKIRPGIDGLIIKQGHRQATFLPQVWEQLPTKEAFLTNLCDKAGLEGDAWKKGDLEVLTYQVQAFEE